jgi:hypothetical protein
MATHCDSVTNGNRDYEMYMVNCVNNIEKGLGLYKDLGPFFYDHTQLLLMGCVWEYKKLPRLRGAVLYN